MSYYNDNVRMIELGRPRLFEMFRDGNPVNNENKLDRLDKVETLEAKDGTSILAIESEGTKYRLNSVYNPLEEAKRWVEQYPFHDHQAVISLFGFGNGIFARELLGKLREGDRLMIYEPSIKIFSFVVEEYDITDILRDERVSITVKGANDYEYHALLRDRVDWINVYSQLLSLHPIYDKVFALEYKDFLGEISDNNLRAVLNRNTAAKMGKAMVKNAVHNFMYLKNSNTVKELCGFIPEEVPVIIVGAGPSLDKNIKTLKLAKGKSIIISTDRALDYLLDQGIEPDFVATLDAIKPVKYFSSRENIAIPLLCKLESNSEILDFHKGRKIWYDSHSYLNEIYDELEKPLAHLNSGGSVSTAAFSVCVAWGMKRIVLIGQDLAYSDGYTHVGGIVGEGENETNIAGMVEDIYGKMVPIRHDWKIFLSWFQDAIEQHPEIDVIDSTEGGAKIKGTTIMPLQETIEKYCVTEIDCKNIIENIKVSLNNEELDSVMDYIKQSIYDLKEIGKKAKEAEECCQKILIACKNGAISSSSNQRILKKISKNNEWIVNKPAYKLIDTYISESSAEHLADIYQFSGKIEDDRIKTFKKAKKMYGAMVEASTEINILIKNMVE